LGALTTSAEAEVLDKSKLAKATAFLIAGSPSPDFRNPSFVRWPYWSGKPSDRTDRSAIDRPCMSPSGFPWLRSSVSPAAQFILPQLKLPAEITRLLKIVI
jgi:hypothetical protein